MKIQGINLLQCKIPTCWQNLHRPEMDRRNVISISGVNIPAHVLISLFKVEMLPYSKKPWMKCP